MRFIHSLIYLLQLIKDDDNLPWYISVPEAPWRMAWDIVILGLVIFAALVVPVRLGFEVEESERDKNIIFSFASRV